MTALEATVEIVKASFTSGGASSATSATYYIADDDIRKKFLKGIEELYKKLEALRNGQ